MPTYAENLAREYAAQREEYKAFSLSVRDLLDRLLQDAGLSIVGIEHRTKSLGSFREKVERPEKAQKYLSCSEVTDLSGIRVITYLQEEHNQVCEIVRENFIIDLENSANREDLLEPDQFGYRSTHFVISYSDDRLKLAEFKRFAGKKAEVQVRTVLQHAWAAIDWKLRYKVDIGVPKDIRRRLYRISALLEAADDDFSLVSKSVLDLRASYEEQIQKGNLSIEVNQESLELFLMTSLVVQRLKEIAAGTKYVIQPPHPNSRNPLLNLSVTLNTAAINTISELDTRLLAAEPRAAEFLEIIFAEWWTERKPGRLVIDMGGLIRLFVIMISETQVARAIIVNSPFGPELQRAVETVVNARTAT